MGNLIWKEDGNGLYTYLWYDSLQRLTNVYYNAGAPASPFVYPTANADVSYGYSRER